MHVLRFVVMALISLVIWPATTIACIWDSDTLLQEKTRFPSALEVITGKFLRHSREFYEWRIQDRLKRLKANPDDLAAYDDLAVAYEKTGDHAKAIALMIEKEHKKPGLYETAANLATFYMLSGNWEEGLKHLDRAIAVNPDAHFGREKYQKYLAEYLLDRRKSGVTGLPLAGAVADYEQEPRHSFNAFLKKQFKTDSLTVEQRQAALKGILGMMRFANYDSPILLECLASVLCDKGAGYFTDDLWGRVDAKQLSARAFLQASYVVKDPKARDAYREWARMTIREQLRSPYGPEMALPLEELEAQFQTELAEARKWYEGVRQNELTWIRDGKDADLEFKRLYYDEPKIEWSPPVERWRTFVTVPALILEACLAMVVCWAIAKMRVERRRRQVTRVVERTEGV